VAKRNPELVVGVDVGTASARAGIFSKDGRLRGLGVRPITVWRLPPSFVEQSSTQVCGAVGEAVREALEQAGATGADVAGIGFDATCSLVGLGEGDRPITTSPEGCPDRDIIVWMDHRATDQARRINATGHRVLRYVGGGFSPEQQPPKLLWLKENLPQTYRTATRFLDLADFLTYWATGEDTRSLCTTVCKWSYMGHERRWDRSFFEAVGLDELLVGQRIGWTVVSPGTPLRPLLPARAAELGLTPETMVAVGIIDAHAGALGVLGMGEEDLGSGVLNRSLALIVGTSSCHLAVSGNARFIPGVWGPYYGALLPDLWLNEGGQSATGALLDHIIESHPASPTLREKTKREGITPYAILNRELERMTGEWPPPPDLTSGLHVLPYFLGNRSPRADAGALGMVSGLGLDPSLEALAALYYASVQALAYGTRHILEVFDAAGYRITALKACGGGTKNLLWLQEHADVTGCRITLPREGEAVVLGAAMLGAVAAGLYPDVATASIAMGAPGEQVRPRPGVVRYHDNKNQVFHLLYDHQKEYDRIMAGHRRHPAAKEEGKPQ
jgi:FGGY-family pentulose kinase